MKRLKLFILILGILNIILGVALTIFVILMQNPLAIIIGLLYVLFGIATLNNKIYKKLLFIGIMPLTILFSINIMMLGIDKSVPEYFQAPLHIGLLIISPLWLVIFGNIWLVNRVNRVNRVRS